MSGTLMTTSSIGSRVLPISSFLIMTSGFETASSYPSLLMFSMRMDRCSSPLPLTLKLSVESVSSTLSPTLTSSSFLSLSRICLDVTYLPAFPAKGDLLTMKYMDSVGSSIEIIGIGSSLPSSQMVSPMDMSGMPETTTMSPATASSTGTRLSPL